VKPESLNTVDFIPSIVLCVLSSNLSVCNCVVLETMMHMVRSLRDTMKGERNKRRALQLCIFACSLINDKYFIG